MCSILRSTYPVILKLIWVPNLELLPFFFGQIFKMLTLANQKKKLFLAAMFIGQMERNGETL
jgi:hypothetical protein